jgi:tRNA-dihydrouridine synthase A
MEYTDRHYRYFMRGITKYTTLFTEMVTTQAILRGKNINKYLGFSKEESPLVLQLGGDDPVSLAKCSKIAEDLGYDGLNLNVGCPSEKVVKGNFGACLMAEPTLVRDCLGSMKQSVKIPVSIKHRIGINGKETYEDLYNFISQVSESGVNQFIIHARIAVLGGLSPAENRSIPPLRYEDVFQIKKDFPHLHIVINGGIKNFLNSDHLLSLVDGIMIGRSAYENPYLFHNADSIFFNKEDPNLNRLETLERMIPYIQEFQNLGVRIFSILRHTIGLYYGIHGGRTYRRFLSENINNQNLSIQEYIKKATESIEKEIPA